MSTDGFNDPHDWDYPETKGTAMSGNFVVTRNKTTEIQDIPTLWIGVRNGRKAFQIEWEPDGPNWFYAGPLCCHAYSAREWRLLLHGKLLGNRIYETAQAARRSAQHFKAVRKRLAR